jgi:hypothetical protein
MKAAKNERKKRPRAHASIIDPNDAKIAHSPQ